MKVAVASLKPQPTLLETQERPADLGLSAESVAFRAPIHVAVKLTRMQEDVLAQGEARTTARAQCSRCLADVDIELVGRFEALFVPQSGASSRRMGSRNLALGDQGVRFYSQLTIDLSSEIAQCLLLELPLRPLCRPQCAGLCPSCGHDLNDGPCECETERLDDTWAALRDLFPPKNTDE